MSQSKSEVTKEKIIRAATQVIRRDGLQACTHRAVAEEAGVSLGTTTYQFRTLDDLLTAVMQLAIDEFSDSTRRWLQLNASGATEDILTRFVMWTLSERSRLSTEYELFVAAVSRPLLRPCAMNWLHEHETLLIEFLHLPPEKARAAVSFIDAWLMRGILDEPETVLLEELIRTVFRAIVTAPQAR
ncbi:transcriptional regulator, TetR family (plasmid) [Enterobacter soli]|uniref:TetR/AcrR family transcriptional regulator n=1 Tax=Enterobacter soli TaxID=885040 RepID=UPI000223CEC5|nr:TetR family transcriptional regulator [Enterobacter soli]AEN67189.1 transcriptional regulator, TetR family [Enterobacter soli]OAT35106.1 TetR family transcriptional regulator [Enterobacter soli ATCC BAA-2102]